MNLRLVSRQLAILAALIGGMMVFSLPWANPSLGYHGIHGIAESAKFESAGFRSLIVSMAICLAVSATFYLIGRKAKGRMFRKEAMAVVGLSWILATVLGALPFLFFGEMGIVDCLFESQSGFSTTGATVITDLEDPDWIPHCILFWRSSTHFLGGLGIIVLFVVILGQGSAGKALMRAEMPGPTKEGATARMQHTAWLFTAMYCGLNLILAGILMFKMNPFDAICHAFGTMATGGFSTYNHSIGAFKDPWVDYIITLFMILAGTNFTLLFFFLIAKRPGKLVADLEWRVYMFIILTVTILVIAFGLGKGDFGNLAEAIRYGLFQVVAIITTTGYGTDDYDGWNSFGRGVLLLLMFVGGCAGSTGGGMKVIRHIMFVKILRLEVEKSYHPTVVRPLRIGGRPVDDPELRKNILVYFALILVLFVFSWLFVVTVEPDSTWSTKASQEHKLIDSASSVAATLNNIGPGLGVVGPKKNYSRFSAPSKILFIWLMMLGRLEIFAILVLFAPGFWRRA